MPTELSDANFQSEVIDSSLPVLVDFWSERCGPCVQLAPMLDQLSEEVEGWAKVAKLNAVEHLPVASRYGVRSLPNLLFFKNGEVKDQLVGSNVTKDQLRQKLEQLR